MIKFNEKCPCGATTEIEQETKDAALEILDAWTARHEGHADPRPKVVGSSSSAERGTRTDPGHEQWSAYGPKVPIVIAKALPFGFVRNEENL